MCDKLFPVQLDEATDSDKDSHFIAYVQFCDGMLAVKELLFRKPIEHKASLIAVFNILGVYVHIELST